jgi:Uma2 family endonuclease
MTVAPAPLPPAASPPRPPRFKRADEWLRSLGNVPPNRILLDPPPGTATVADVIRLSHHENRGVELVDGTLVEKPVGFLESIIASNVITLLNVWAKASSRGLVTGEQGMIRMLMGNVRMPDVAFFCREDLPGGQVPKDAAPQLAPALAVEVLSAGNTGEEMRIKLGEYFASGVRVVWILDPPTRTLRVYDAPERFRQLTGEDTLDAGTLLPGFTVRVGQFFET